MATKAVELREKRANIISEARAKWNEAEKRDGGLTEEDKTSFDAAMDGADKLKADYERLERLEEAEGDAEAPTERKSSRIEPEERSGAHNKGEVSKSRKDYRHFLKTGEVRQDLRAEQGRLGEYRDTIISTDGKGGYLIAPVQVSDDIVKAINDQVFIRQLATVQRVTEAKKLGIRKMTTRMADADWTTEVAAVTEDVTMAFDRRDLEPQLLSKLSKASIRTLNLSADAEKLINDELAYKFGITEEKAFLTGNGTGKPLGVFTASASGISTGRDITAGSATAIVADDLINAKFAVKQGYLQDPSAGWIMHRDLVKMIRKLKNSGDGQYVWQAGLQSGAPDRILDVPYYMSEYAPNTFTTGLYVAVIGNLKYYRIAEVIDLVIQRLVERYADTNEVGFIGRRWVDGAPLLEEAFARIKLA